MLPRQRSSAALREQSEAVVEAGVDLVDRIRRHERGGELQRERNAVEARAQARNGARRFATRREIVLLMLSAIDEQLNRIRLQYRVGVGARFGDRQRGQSVHLLAPDPQRFAARRENRRLRASLKQRLGQSRGRVDDMLAVVEDQQQSLSRDAPAQRFDETRAG